MPQKNGDSTELLEKSTQTEPGMWTPGLPESRVISGSTPDKVTKESYLVLFGMDIGNVAILDCGLCSFIQALR